MKRILLALFALAMAVLAQAQDKVVISIWVGNRRDLVAETVARKLTAQIYRSGHVDILVDCMKAIGGRLLVRSGGHEATMRWPIGAKVGNSIGTDESVAFATNGN